MLKKYLHRFGQNFLHPRVYIFIFLGSAIIFLTFFTTNNALEIAISGIASVFIGIGVNNFSSLETHQKDEQTIKAKIGHSLKVMEMAHAKIENMETDLTAGNYQQAKANLMDAPEISETITNIREEVLDGLISEFIPPQSLEEQWNTKGLEEALQTEFNSHQPVSQWIEADHALDESKLRERIHGQINAEYTTKSDLAGPDMRVFEKQVMLQVLDQLWKEHLATMDHLRQGIHLRAYAQKQPKQEYKREAFEMFQNLLANIKRDVVRILAHVRIQTQEEIEEAERTKREAQLRQMQFLHADAAALAEGDDGSSPDGAAYERREEARAEPFKRNTPKVGRNEPCPCGSGKKYKHCHGAAA